MTASTLVHRPKTDPSFIEARISSSTSLEPAYEPSTTSRTASAPVTASSPPPKLLNAASKLFPVHSSNTRTLASARSAERLPIEASRRSVPRTCSSRARIAPCRSATLDADTVSSRSRAASRMVGRIALHSAGATR